MNLEIKNMDTKVRIVLEFDKGEKNIPQQLKEGLNMLKQTHKAKQIKIKDVLPLITHQDPGPTPSQMLDDIFDVEPKEVVDESDNNSK